jgi:hypothetical protein
MPATFLTGPAGTGKTTRAVEHLRDLLRRKVPGHTILVIVPQHTLARPYREALRDPRLPGAAAVEVLTLNGLALKTIELFWPLGAVSSGFARPDQPPIFLNIEQSQYYLHQAIAPLLAQGYFDPNVVPMTISLPRLMSQILDNLNKAALIGLPYQQVGQHLAASLTLEPNSRVALEHTQSCVDAFRRYCLTRNLLDFSLRIETFARHLWPVLGVQKFLTGRYHHLIADNLEEDTPFAHTILRQWAPQATSAWLINDEDAGYRIFLGANWRTAAELSNLCPRLIESHTPHVAPPDMLALGRQLAGLATGQPLPEEHPPVEPPNPRRVITFEQTRFYPQMIDWVIDRIIELVKQGADPGQIVVLAPFVSDALRFSFIQRMAQKGLAARSHRPSRPLSDEPAARALLTLARLAFPHWGLLPEPFDVAQAFSQAIAGLDLIRANLLTQVVYRHRGQPAQSGQLADILTPFEQIDGPIRERISYEVGLRFDRLRGWLIAVQLTGQQAGLDHFFGRLFSELLSQRGFGFWGQPEAGRIIANLIDSARQFRRVAAQVPLAPGSDALPAVDAVNRAWLDTIAQGIAAAQYVRGWNIDQTGSDGAVLITPATTFLMSNRPVDYQFWLDAGSSGWWERIAQPLTHPYILAADWPPGRSWTDADEVAAQQDRLARLLLGLTRRCRRHIFIANAEIGEQGYEQRGQLLMILQRMLRRLQSAA